MEFKLKEGWFDYFFSGAIIGAFAVLLSALQYFQTEITVTFEVVLGLIFIFAMAVFSFIMGCRVKKK